MVSLWFWTSYVTFTSTIEINILYSSKDKIMGEINVLQITL